MPKIETGASASKKRSNVLMIDYIKNNDKASRDLNSFQVI